MQEIRLEYVHRSQTYLTASHSQLCYFCYFLINGRDGEKNGFLAGVPLLPPPSRPSSLPLFFRTPATQAKQTKNGFATEHLHISHNTPCLPPKILHNLKFFFVLGLQLSQENWRQCQLMFLRFVFFWGGGGGEGGKQGALWDNAHMANRVKSTLFWPLEKCRVSALDWRLTGTFSNMLNTMQTKLNHG